MWVVSPHRSIGCLLVGALLVSCTRDGAPAAAPSTTAARTPAGPPTTDAGPATTPASTIAPETSAATPPPTRSSTAPTTAATVPPTTSSAPELPTDADLLAGARVLCAFEGATAPQHVLTAVGEGRAAGVLLFAANLASQVDAVAGAEAVQAAAGLAPLGLPAIVAVDQEGGRVARLPGPPSASAEELGGLPAPRIQQEGRDTAANLLAWGVNVDLAPVADVARAGTFLDAQDRSFGSNPNVVAGAVRAFVAGLHDGGVAATLKHFPGLGAADANTDRAAARVDIDADTWWAIDAVPFIAGVDVGADLVMLSSAVYRAFDTVPAVLSPAVVGGLLRGDLGFDRVVISDALGTPALTPFGTLAETALAAATAGVDLFISNDPDACGDVQRALADAIRSGALSLQDAQASYRRLAALRANLR